MPSQPRWDVLRDREVAVPREGLQAQTVVRFGYHFNNLLEVFSDKFYLKYH